MLGFSNQFSAILFRQNSNDLAKYLTEIRTTTPIDIIATIEINSWMGIDKIQIQIEDVILISQKN